MSSSYGEKLKAIRHAEKLTQPEFSALTGVSLGAIRNYETGHSGVGLNVIEKIMKHVTLKKYAMWIMTDEVAPSIGQIAPTLSDSQESRAKSGRKAKNAEKVVTQISSQKPDMQAIISSLSNLDDDEIQQLSRLLSRRGAMFLLELLEPDNQTLIGLEGDKKQAALQLESMNKEQVREILSKIEGNNRQFTEDINDFIEKAS